MTENVGLGYKKEYPDQENLTFDDCWASFVEKAYKPDLYLPVKDVIARDQEDGTIYREMTMGESRIIEEITLDKTLARLDLCIYRKRKLRWLTCYIEVHWL
jgi:hypothetical protein